MTGEQAIRTAFYQALKNLTYQGKAVDVTDIWTEVKELTVTISTQSSTGNHNKNAYNFNGSLTLDIAELTNGSGSRDAVDEISDLIYAIIFPNRNTYGITPSGYQLLNLRLTSSNYLTEETGIGYIVRKILVFNYYTTKL